jgi:hypothetical protein
MLQLPAMAQDDMDAYYENPVYTRKGWVIGLYAGSYFPNKKAASLYDGYGYDLEGNKNNFENSWMNYKINEQYGDKSINDLGPDLISPALGLANNEFWKFENSDYMPINMRFKTAFSIGLNTRYSRDGKNGVLLNLNASILKATGNFNILVPSSNTTQINKDLNTFEIAGEEQRLHLQLGYQGVLGPEQGIQFLLEGGLHATLAKFVNNEIQINDLVISLADEFQSPNGDIYFTGTRPVGLGFGAFAGLGFDVNTSGPWDLQLVYSPLLERVNIGWDRRLRLSQTVGLRAYYKLNKK